MAETPTLPALLVDAAGVGAMLSLSRTKIYQMDSSGELGPVALKFGGRRRWRVDEISEWARRNCPCRREWLAMGGA